MSIPSAATLLKGLISTFSGKSSLIPILQIKNEVIGGLTAQEIKAHTFGRYKVRAKNKNGC